MPPISKVTCAQDALTFTDWTGVQKQLLVSSIPNIATATIAQVESFINGEWIPVNVSGYQMQVHVLSLNPLLIAVMTANVGATIAANWWMGA